MILTVLGGSAHSTPVLLRNLINAFTEEHVVIRLVGRHESRLRAVARACRLLASCSLITVEAYKWPDWRTAVSGSHAVLVQVRPGGYQGRAFDESFPLDYNVPADEGLGPGGLSAAWRSWPVVREIVGGIRVKAPGATILLLTSPIGLLVRLSGEGVIGLCELPWTTLCTICGSSQRALRASFDYHGVNHIGWLYNIRVDGEVLPLPAGTAFPSASLVRKLQAWPLKYLRLHYCSSDVISEQKRAPAARARQLAEIAQRAFDVFMKGNRKQIADSLCARGAEWYADAVVPILRTVRGYGAKRPLFLTMAGQDEIQERCYRAAGGTLAMQELSAVPPREVARAVVQFVRYEKAAALAVFSRSEELAVEALMLHPWITSREQAAGLARRLVTQTTGETYAST